jgi:heme oxygenase
MNDSIAVPVSPALTLREQTADNHKRAEQSDFQRRFVTGKLSREHYAGWLEQMWFIYGALAKHLGSASAHPVHAAIFASGRDRTPELEADLEFLGLAPDARKAVPATRAFVARIDEWAAAGGAELLGALYVLEGSTNGSKYIARAVRKAYEFAGAEGTRFLDPYGEEQMARWQEFRGRLDAGVAPADVPAVVQAARETFDAVSAIGQELLRT